MSKRTSKVPCILVVDDEPDLRELVELTLLKMGLDVKMASGVEEAKVVLDAGGVDLCLTDMRMGDGSGLDVVRHIQTQGFDVPIAVITAYGSLDNAVEALKAGAFDYLAKPVSLDQLRTLVRSALVLDTPAAKVVEQGERTFIGESPALQQALQLIDRLARNQAPVYLTGESGSGKERAARLIHAQSSRAAQPFVAVNCGAIPENLMESEFFGTRKGAFTGADAERDGFFQAANGGTLFLDEIGNLPLAGQVKLLRVLETGRFERLGSSRTRETRVRVISATNADLKAMVAQGSFREDLYYRLNVVELRLPALAERRDDVMPLAEHFLAGSARLSDAARELLLMHAWSGNVRELKNVMARAALLCRDGLITPADLGLEQGGAATARNLDEPGRDAIVAALRSAGGVVARAAQQLGLSRQALYRRMERYGLGTE